jgi:hypothetical protein
MASSGLEPATLRLVTVFQPATLPRASKKEIVLLEIRFTFSVLGTVGYSELNLSW